MQRVVNIEPTPNPDALKFVVGSPLLTGGARSFRDFASSVGDPLASSLFALGGVSSVFYMDGFVTVNKASEAEWTDLIDPVCEAIEDTMPGRGGDVCGVAPGGDGRLQKIMEAIDGRIRPGLAGDGGGLEVVSFDGATLTIAYQGACGSCPAAATGTLQFIEGLLRSEVDPGIRVTVI